MTALARDVEVRASHLAWLVAGCSAGAGLIHFTVVSEHNAGDIIVPIGFALTGLLQVAVAAALVSRRSTKQVALAAIVVNVAATAVWAWSRTKGLPFQPYNGVAEAPGVVDLTSAGLQAAAVTGAVGLLTAPRALRVPAPLAAAFGVGALALASVVVVTPEPAQPVQVASSSASGAAPAAAGDGHGHSHGGSAAASTANAAAGDHAADMLRIDRARCDLSFNPQAYWDEALAMGVDTYTGGAMTMEAPGAVTRVAGAEPLQGRGSENLDRLISLTSISSGEVAAAQMVDALSTATDEEYEAWRRWVATNPSGGHDAPTATNVPAPPTMGHAGPLTWTAMTDPGQCEQLAAELDQARSVAAQYPTVADAVEVGYFPVTPYLPGIAAHYMKFDIVDGTFDISEPEMLLYDGTDDDSAIVGLSYYVSVEGSAGPTQGFTGPNDSYHRHFGLCVGAGGVIGDSTTTEAECAARGGRKSEGLAGWMSHAWVVPGCESPWGVFSGENPVLDGQLGQQSGTDGGGCRGSHARERYDLEPGQSDLAVSGADQAAGR